MFISLRSPARSDLVSIRFARSRRESRAAAGVAGQWSWLVERLGGSGGGGEAVSALKEEEVAGEEGEEKAPARSAGGLITESRSGRAGVGWLRFFRGETGLRGGGGGGDAFSSTALRCAVEANEGSLRGGMSAARFIPPEIEENRARWRFLTSESPGEFPPLFGAPSSGEVRN